MLYIGMSVTNTIRDNVFFDNTSGWREEQMTNDEIIQELQSDKKRGFMSFSWGVWVTAHARYNLMKNVIKLDEYTVYCDTDSIKLIEGYDKRVIEEYNTEVEQKIKLASKILAIDYEKFAPKDKKGIVQMLGLFEHENYTQDSPFTYKEFITQGAKKYAYKDFEDKIHITVAGVPKKGSTAIKSLDEFRDDLEFKFEDTGKNILFYTEEQEETEITDYLGTKDIVTDKSGCCILPCSYILR